MGARRSWSSAKREKNWGRVPAEHRGTQREQPGGRGSGTLASTQSPRIIQVPGTPVSSVGAAKTLFSSLPVRHPLLWLETPISISSPAPLLHPQSPLRAARPAHLAFSPAFLGSFCSPFDNESGRDKTIPLPFHLIELARRMRTCIDSSSQYCEEHALSLL